MIRLNNGLLLTVYFQTQAIQRVTRKGFVYVTETTCHLVDGHFMLGSGHAICSPTESYNQGYGYGLALSRAIDDFSDVDQDFLDYDDAERIKRFVLDAYLKDLKTEQAFYSSFLDDDRPGNAVGFELTHKGREVVDVQGVGYGSPAPTFDPYAGVPDADFDI